MSVWDRIRSRVQGMRTAQKAAQEKKQDHQPSPKAVAGARRLAQERAQHAQRVDQARAAQAQPLAPAQAPSLQSGSVREASPAAREQAKALGQELRSQGVVYRGHVPSGTTVSPSPTPPQPAKPAPTSPYRGRQLGADRQPGPAPSAKFDQVARQYNPQHGRQEQQTQAKTKQQERPQAKDRQR